jgi:hypothetical protein
MLDITEINEDIVPVDESYVNYKGVRVKAVSTVKARSDVEYHGGKDIASMSDAEFKRHEMGQELKHERPSKNRFKYASSHSIYSNPKAFKTEEAENIEEAVKKGDFVKLGTGEIHRVFDVTDNTLHTAPYRGANQYGGNVMIHKTKATKTDKPDDINEEIQLDEIRELAKKYKEKAEAQVKELKPWTKKGEYKDLAKNAIKKREAGIAKANQRIPEEVEEETEQIDELAAATLDRYVTKSAMSYGELKKKGNYKKAEKRFDGSLKAADKLASKNEEVETKEEVVEESTNMDRYVKAIADDVKFSGLDSFRDYLDK